MIVARQLTRTFGDRVAVEDVTFDVQAGEVFGLLGPNGAGKTTTLRMLAGLIAPSTGEASVAGIPLSPQTIDGVRAKVGFLTEAPGLWERLSVWMNLLTYARLYQLPDPEGAVTRVLQRFDLLDRRDSLGGELSKGLKQRVAIARTLMHDPAVVLLDEPTSGLDPQSSRMVREVILDLRARGHAVIISTHNLDEAERVSDRVGVLRRRFLAIASPQELRRRVLGSRVRVVIDGDADGFVDVARQAGGREVEATGRQLSVSFEHVEAETPALVRALVLAGAQIVSVAPDDQPLEEAYFALVGRSGAEEIAS